MRVQSRAQRYPGQYQVHSNVEEPVSSTSALPSGGDDVTASVVVRFDGALAAQCGLCGVHLEWTDGAPIEMAVRAFRAHHPMTSSLPHSRAVPDGWTEGSS